jgi:hypothetical protein
MADIYKANEDIVLRVKNIIKDNHPELFLIQDEIAILIREKAGKRGGRITYAKTMKAPKILEILGDTDYKFILEIAGDEWQNLSSPQQTALLDHHLCAMRAEEEEETGEVKYFVAPPDIGYYYDELDRHGNWRPELDGEDPDELEGIPSIDMASIVTGATTEA